MPRRWPAETLAIGLAHAVAFTLVAHCHYAVRPPTRVLWVAAELGLAFSLWLPARLLVARVFRPAYEAVPPTRRRLFIALPLALGAFVSLWWAGAIQDTLWLFPPAAKDALSVVLTTAHASILAAGYATLLAPTVAVARDDDTPPPTPGPRRETVAIGVSFALFVLAATAFAGWFVGSERTIYFWDYITYWTKSSDLAALYRTGSPADVWNRIRVGTRADDYGPLPAVLAAAALATIGDSRLVYVVAVVGVYLTAFAAAAYAFVRRFAPAGNPVAVVVPLLAVLLCPVAWFPLVCGYPDIGGAALGILVLLTYLSRPAGGLPWPRVVLLAGLLVGMTLFRRWYSFFVVAFVLTAGVDTLISAARGLRIGWGEAARRVGTLALVGAWSAALLLSFAPGWVVRAATTDYADLYVAYKTLDPLADRVWRTVDMCGTGTLGLAAAGLAVLLGFRDTRRPAVVLAAMCPVMLLHFLRVQNFGWHHLYLFLPALTLLPALALVRLLTPAPGLARWTAVTGFAAIGAMMMAVGFVPAALPLRDEVRPAVSSLVFYPLVRDDLPEFRRLLRAADEAAAGTDGGTAAVVASSLTINPSMFLVADRSLGEPLFRAGRLIDGPELDRVGGFPGVVLRADVVVVPDPPQTHLRLEEQQAVVIPAEDLLHGTGIGVGFDRLPGDYHLANGVTVRLYRRTRPIPRADFEAFCARLRAAHPTRPVFFTPPPGLEDELAFPRR